MAETFKSVFWPDMMDSPNQHFDDFEGLMFYQRLYIALVITSPFIAYICWLFREVKRYPNQEHLPWAVSRFLLKYGPTLWDWVLATRPVRCLRGYRIAYLNSRRHNDGQAMLLELPDELLLVICDMIVTHTCSRCQGRIAGCIRQRSAKRELLGFSRTCKRIRGITAPRLFASVGSSPYGWWRAHRAIDCLSSSTTVLEHAESARFDLSMQYDEHSKYVPRKFPKRLAMSLSSFTGLDTLSIILPDAQTEPFRKVFQNRNLTLPTVRSLTVGPHTTWMIGLCPNVRSVAASSTAWRLMSLRGMPPEWLNIEEYLQNRVFDFIYKAATAPELEHLGLPEIDDWYAVLLTISKVMPTLQSLAQVGMPYRLDLDDNDIYNILPRLGLLENLKTLYLDPVWHLNIGIFRGGCGNPYLGPDGDRLRAQEEMEEREAEVEVAMKVFNELRGLEVLWFGNCRRADAKRKKAGGLDRIEWSLG